VPKHSADRLLLPPSGDGGGSQLLLMGSGARPLGCHPRRWARKSRRHRPRWAPYPVTSLEFPFTGVRRGGKGGQLSRRPTEACSDRGERTARRSRSHEGTDTTGGLAPSVLGEVLTNGHQSTKPTGAR
jgi:hypothetical protein